MYDQLATIALDMIAQVSVKAGDKEIQTVAAVRRMLRRIEAKELIIGEPVPEAPPTIPPAEKPA
jgi:hypothetical protein